MIGSRPLLSITALLLALAGGTGVFAPELIIGAGALWPGQLLGAAWLGLAALDWTGRGTIIGGIYGRPLLLANSTNFLIGALVLLRAALVPSAPGWLWAAFGVSAVLAGLYGWRLVKGAPERELNTSPG